MMDGHGLRVQRDGDRRPGVLRLPFPHPCPLPASDADGAQRHPIELGAAEPELSIPMAAVVRRHHRDGSGGWVVGRAGMRYRDLLPDRQGGRFIASHIAIPDGGPVPDYVHHHRIRFQLIFCHRGWVRGGLRGPGPAVRPPGRRLRPATTGIRHRVLEASPGLEVVELSCPAEHVTLLDHELELPTRRSGPTGTSAGSASSATGPPRRLAAELAPRVRCP